MINNLQGGGAEKLLADICMLNSKNYSISVVVLNNLNSKYYSVIKSYSKIFVLSKSKKYNPVLLFRLMKIIISIKPDVIHAHLFPSFYFSAIVSFFISAKFVYTEHNTKNKRRNNIITRLSDKFFYSKFDKIICITGSVKQSLISSLSLNKHIQNRIIVIENGIIIPQNVKPKNILNKIPKILMIGRFEVQKDQKSVIIASKYVRVKSEFHFFGDGSLIEECKKIANSLNSKHKFYFHGFVENIHNKIDEFDISILSSLYEGFGLAALESMSHAIPTIGSNVSGLNEVISNKQFLFDVGDSKMIAKKVNKLIENKNFYMNTSKESLKLSKKYDIKITLEKYNNIYNQQ